jgi:hypothetical protein
VASKLLDLAAQNLNLGFGIILFFVVFEFGFVVAVFIFAEPLLHALAGRLGREPPGCGGDGNLLLAASSQIDDKTIVSRNSLLLTKDRSTWLSPLAIEVHFD